MRETLALFVLTSAIVELAPGPNMARLSVHAPVCRCRRCKCGPVVNPLHPEVAVFPLTVLPAS